MKNTIVKSGYNNIMNINNKQIKNRSSRIRIIHNNSLPLCHNRIMKYFRPLFVVILLISLVSCLITLLYINNISLICFRQVLCG